MNYEFHNIEQYYVWREISYSVKQKVILQNINGYIKSGNIMAIMGSSGSGKTTFLKQLLKDVKINNSIIVSYVPQNDIFNGELTVYENIKFVSSLKILNNNNKREDRINNILKTIGLNEIRNIQVKYISGGQKRRLSIGAELVNEPALLLVDEPTSGLDSNTAILVINTIKKIVDSLGIAVILTIHQPSIQIINNFDYLCFISHGQQAYFGPQKNLIGYIRNIINKSLPLYTNPSDYFIELLSENVSIINQFRQSNEYQLMQNEITRINNLSKVPIIIKEPEKKISLWREIYILSNRFWIIFWRHKPFFWYRFIMYVIMALIMGSLFYNLSHVNQESVRDRTSILFFSVQPGIISVSVLPIFLQDKLIYIHERENNYYRAFSYSFAYSIVSFVFIFLFSIGYFAVLYFMTGLAMTLYQGGIFFLTLVLALYLGEGLVIMVSALVDTFIGGLAIVTGVFGIMTLTCGFLIRASRIPIGWIWSHYISFYKYIFEVFVINELTNSNFECEKINNTQDLSSLNNSLCFCAYPDLNNDCYLSGNEILQEFEYDNVNIYLWLIIIAGQCLFYRIAFHFAISNKRVSS